MQGRHHECRPLSYHPSPLPRPCLESPSLLKTNASITPEWRQDIWELDEYSRQNSVSAALRRAHALALHRLGSEPQVHEVAVVLDAAELGLPLPPAAGSVRVVAGRAAAQQRLERHANSHQFLLALGGPLQTHVKTARGWRVDRYGHATNAGALDERWHVVPAGQWHKTETAGPQPWVVATFHSAVQVSDEYDEYGEPG